jgi:two-component system response regulator FixJ
MSGTSPNDPTPTVFVVDDDSGTRKAITWLLEAHGRRVEGFASGEAFLQAYRPERSGCLILDLRLPGMSGLALQEELARRKIGLPVIMLTGYGAVSSAVEAMQRGAIEFLEKPVDETVLLQHIDRAFGLDAERRRREGLQHDRVTRVGRLTRREREVMRLIAAGKPNKEVAWDLGISHKTVEVHRARVMSKLGVRSLADLVRLEWLIVHDAAAGWRGHADAWFPIAE